jgi:hypothetical protein
VRSDHLKHFSADRAKSSENCTASVCFRADGRFYRGNPSRNREEGGNGLGLAIDKWIANAHSAQITDRRPFRRRKSLLRLPANLRLCRHNCVAMNTHLYTGEKPFLIN